MENTKEATADRNSTDEIPYSTRGDLTPISDSSDSSSRMKEVHLELELFLNNIRCDIFYVTEHWPISDVSKSIDFEGYSKKLLLEK